MTPTVTFDEFGRIAIPQEIRVELGLRPGDTLELDFEDRRVTASAPQDEPRIDEAREERSREILGAL